MMDNLMKLYLTGVGSVVGTATAYGMDGPGIESRWGRDFLYLSRWALSLERVGCDINYPPTSSTEVRAGVLKLFWSTAHYFVMRNMAAHP